MRFDQPEFVQILLPFLLSEVGREYHAARDNEALASLLTYTRSRWLWVSLIENGICVLGLPEHSTAHA
jgi:hypothetical protein